MPPAAPGMEYAMSYGKEALHANVTMGMLEKIVTSV